VAHGDRLILQLQFSNSLFGATYPAARFEAQVIPDLVTARRLFPDVYSSFSR